MTGDEENDNNEEEKDEGELVNGSAKANSDGREFLEAADNVIQNVKQDRNKRGIYIHFLFPANR